MMPSFHRNLHGILTCILTGFPQKNKTNKKTPFLWWFVGAQWVVCVQRAEFKVGAIRNADLSSRRRVPLGLTAPHSRKKRWRIPGGSPGVIQMSHRRIGGRRLLELKRLISGAFPAVALPPGCRRHCGPDSSPPRLTRHRSRQFQPHSVFTTLCKASGCCQVQRGKMSSPPFSFSFLAS